MNILQIAPQVPFPVDQGGRISIYGITKYLALRGHKVHLAAYTKDADLDIARKELSKYAALHFINEFPKNDIGSAFKNLFSGVPYNIDKFYSEKLEKFLRKFLPENNIDIVHLDHLHMAWTIDVIKEISDVPVVLREHNLELKIMERYFKGQKNPVLKLYSRMQYNKFLKYEPRTAGRADLSVMISPVDEAELKRMNPLVKSVTIPVGVESEMLSRSRYNTEPYSLFHLGAMDWFPNYHGLSWFLQEVFPYVVNEIPQVKLYIYGGGSEKIKVPESLKKNIILRGYQMDLWTEIMQKDIAIVPLKIGSGIRVKIIEMLAAGQIVLSTPVGKEGIEVTDLDNILLADTARDFRDRLIKYFRNGYDRQKISASAKELIRERYTWERIAERFEEEYLNLINKKYTTV